jgi:hypothetical protein
MATGCCLRRVACVSLPLPWATTRLDVVHDLLHGQVGGLRRLLEILHREMAGIPMIVMNLTAPTGDTHATDSFP